MTYYVQHNLPKILFTCHLIPQNLCNTHHVPLTNQLRFQDFLLIRGLNSSFAFFINDCLSLMDRGFVFRLIRLYMKTVSVDIYLANTLHRVVATVSVGLTAYSNTLNSNM